MIITEAFDVADEVGHGLQTMWEISPSQLAERGKFRDYRLSVTLWDIPRVSGINIKAIRDRIETEMKAKGFSRRSLSTAAGLSQTAVRDVLDRTENPGNGTLHKIADALTIPVEDVTGASGVPLLGEIGAGGTVAYFEDEPDDTRMAPRPPLAVGQYMALVVRGESMLPKYDPGDVVYVRREHEGVLPQYLGKYCAIHLADGGTYLKILSAGSMQGRYTLRSLNAADMENVEVVWASPVVFVWQAAAVDAKPF